MENQDTETQEEEAVFSQKHLGWEKTDSEDPSKKGGGRSKGTLGLLTFRTWRSDEAAIVLNVSQAWISNHLALLLP